MGIRNLGSGELGTFSTVIRERRDTDKQNNREIVDGLLKKYPYGLRKIQLENTTLAVFDCRLLYKHYEETKAVYRYYQEQIPGFRGSPEDMFLQNNGRTCFVLSEAGLTTVKRNHQDTSYLELDDAEIQDMMKQIQNEIDRRGNYFSPMEVKTEKYQTITYYKGLLDENLNPGFAPSAFGTMIRAIDNLAKEEGEETKPIQNTVKDMPREENVRVMLQKI
jgi:hypothetical protein